MLIDRRTLLELDNALRAADGTVRSASVEVDIDPLDVVRAGAESFGWAGFYTSPDGRSVGGLGTALQGAASGPGRFEVLEDTVRRVPEGVGAFIGFSFDEDGPSGVDWEGFPGSSVILPEVTVTRSAGRSKLTVAVRPGSDGTLVLRMLAALRIPAAPRAEREVDHTVESRPAPDDWRELVVEAVDSIGAGAFTKVVLARSVLVHTLRPLDGFDLVAQLRNRYPECRVFGWQQGDAVFVGASPELLVARQGERFQLHPLAGSAPRGADPDDDRRLGDALLASDKDRREHAVVVEDAVERLGALTASVNRPVEPVLKRYATVQHLATPVTGTTGARVLDLVAALHPTPAVGGAPRAEALAFIAKQEGIDRGWYSGGIGWVEPGGDGEIAVALRCALVRGDHAIVYAGNGIVAGSHPEEELAETRLKLRPMLELLTGQ